MAKIKICGITRKEDIVFVNKYIPEYIGFVFAKSGRQVSPEHVVSITEGLDKRIRKVGVFVNEKIDEIIYIAKRCSLDVIQIHGDETADYMKNLEAKLGFDACREEFKNRVEIWKGIRVKDIKTIKNLGFFNVDAFVLDAFVKGSYGGAGKTFDWDLAAMAGEYGKIILAGGLNTDNILEARNYVRPYAVDVSSGVEKDGYKDQYKIRDFICIARSY